MTLKVSTTHAQRVAAALDDNRKIAKLFERTATNVWTLIENDQVGHYARVESGTWLSPSTFSWGTRGFPSKNTTSNFNGYAPPVRRARS